MSRNTLTYILPLTANDTPEKFTAIISHYAKTCTSKTRFSTTSNREFLGLHFNLSEDLNYTVNELYQGTIKHWSFNLIYIPERTRIEYLLEPGNYQMFSIKFPVKFLQLWSDQYPLLQSFLERASRKEITMMALSYRAITAEMYKLIMKVLSDRNTGTGRDVSIRPKLYEILPPCLKMFHSNRTVPVRIPHAKQIKEAHDYILQNLQYNISPNFLADKFEIDKRKLGKGFKDLYHTTMIEFLLEERIKKAMVLLRDPGMSMRDIAAAIGYKWQQNFSDAFRKKMGKAPIEYRRDDQSVDR